MSSRRNQNPGVEINEIDRSAYGKVDYSLPNSPTVFVAGFASKGEDYAIQWINSRSTLDDTYGQPTNEFEQYFYDAIYEVLNRGGTCIASKLPYKNPAKDQYNFTEFSLTFSTLSSHSNDVLSILNANDNSLTSCIEIKSSVPNANRLSYSGYQPISKFDEFLTKQAKVTRDTIRIYDVTRAQYSKLVDCQGTFISSDIDAKENDFLGIVPVIVTPANALFFQSMLDFNISSISAAARPAKFNQTASFTSLANKHVTVDMSQISSYLLVPIQSQIDVGEDTTPSREQWISQESLSKMASDTFPLINYSGEDHYQQSDMKKIGVAVFKAFQDADNNGKINFQLLESFVGSLDPRERDPITKSSIFIDDIVNEQSQFIRLFSNANQDQLTRASTLVMSQQEVVSLGFYKVDCRKIIDYSESILQPLNQILVNAQNPYTLPLDIVIDAGMSNIAQLAYAYDSDRKQIDVDAMPKVSYYSSWKLEDRSSTIGWRAILKKYDDFCKYTRKDCMLIADGLRPFCLDGDVKIVRKTKPQNTVSNAIVPKLKFMSNVFDSSYSAGYCNWFYQQDRSTTDFIWLPPSIKMAGVYIYCDTYFQPWSAPAGLTRGVLTDVVDVAFTPNEDEAGKIYSAQWNYAMNYPLDGIVVEGHKTFQTQRTALDRVNVRRLMLYLEKQTVRIARRFVYESNTPYLRQSFVDAVRPIYEDAVHREGLREYAIKCDDELNTAQAIENNELRCRIAVKPTKVVDFIVIDLIATRQSASVSEEVLR